MGIEINKKFKDVLNENQTAGTSPNAGKVQIVAFHKAQEFDGIDLDFPIDAFSGSARAAVEAVADHSQAPIDLCGQSVLGAMSTASSMYGDVENIMESVMPMAVFLMTIAKSGERKSTVDGLCNGGIRAFEKKNFTDSEEEQSGEIWFSEPTYEGLLERLENGPGIGFLANDDAAGWFGSHSMSRDQRDKTISGLCQLFSGQAIKRPRVTKRTKPLIGTSLTMHMMFQPYLLKKIYGDRTLCEQGILPRALLAFPQSKMGERLYRKPSEKAKG